MRSAKAFEPGRGSPRPPDDGGWIEEHGGDKPRNVDALRLDELEPGRLHRFAVTLMEDGASRSIRVPVMIAQGTERGTVVGLTAALHGNELNGIPTIHRVFERIDPAALRGTVVAVPIANMPGYLRNRREFLDGRDLNRVMPGKPNGIESQVYAYRLIDRIVRHFDILLDLHTASFGRVNSLYVRADMRSPGTAELARWVAPQIIVHNEGGDGTLRAAAADLGIRAITIEIGNPQTFSRRKIKASRIGVRDVLEHLGMVPPDEEVAPYEPVECDRSYWLYTDTGGLLEVLPDPTDRVEQGEPIAYLTDPWGQRIRTYHAPESGIVVGKSNNPVATTGSRILHLGLVAPRA